MVYVHNIWKYLYDLGDVEDKDDVIEVSTVNEMLQHLEGRFKEVINANVYLPKSFPEIPYYLDWRLHPNDVRDLCWLWTPNYINSVAHNINEEYYRDIDLTSDRICFDSLKCSWRYLQI